MRMDTTEKECFVGLERSQTFQGADKSVSIDLLVRANLALGATPRELKHAF